MIQKFAFFFLILFYTSPSSIQAHDYWIKPSKFHLEEPGFIAFDLTASHQYFGMEENPLHEHFAIDVFGPKAELLPLPTILSGHLRAAGEINLTQNGTHLIAAHSLQPLYYTQFKEGGGMRIAKDKAPKDKALRTGRYVKSIKTYVTVGTPTQAPVTPRGYTIELVPQQHPSSITKGMTVAFQVLYEGKPLPNIELLALKEGFVSTEHGDVLSKVTTNTQGIGQFTFSESGIWLVYCKYELETPNNSKADFENYRAYLMLNVK